MKEIPICKVSIDMHTYMEAFRGRSLTRAIVYAQNAKKAFSVSGPE